MMLARFLTATIAVGFLVGCAPVYKAPEEAVTLTGSTADDGETSTILVRTVFYGSGGAIAEISGGRCHARAPGLNAKFTTPRKIEVPTGGDTLPNLSLTCHAVVGASERKAEVVVAPKKNGTGYRETVKVLFH